MKPWISAADAPGYEVVMLITVFDSFGYWRIGRLVAARKPISRISRLTTTDSTGRLMKISVIAIAMVSLAVSVARRLRGNWGRRIGRDGDGGARLQLELADRDDTVSGLQALQDLRPSVDPLAGLHEGAHRAEAGLAVFLFLIGHDVDGIAVQRVVDRGLRHGDHCRVVRQHDGGGREHAWLEDLVGIGDRGL